MNIKSSNMSRRYHCVGCYKKNVAYLGYNSVGFHLLLMVLICTTTLLCTPILVHGWSSAAGTIPFSNSRGSRMATLYSDSLSASSLPSPSASFFASQEEYDSKEEHEGYVIHVAYEDRSCGIFVKPNETILEAIERSGTPQLLSMPSPPSDCRRGSCMACAAIILEQQQQFEESSSSTSSNSTPDTKTTKTPTTMLVTVNDGLSPYQSKVLQSKGYILTCCSYVQGSGLSIKLNYQNDIWEEMYKTRLQDESVQCIGRQASAKVIRMAAERNIPKFKAQTEKAWENS